MQPENQQNDTNWAFRQEGNDPVMSDAVYEQHSVKTDQAVTWTASEFIAHHKTPAWYATVFGSFLAVCVVIYLTTRDVISVIAIMVVVVLFMVVSSKKPRQQTYSMDSHGITIGSKSYPYSEFKSFALQHEGAFGYVSLVPLKRFMPEISIYFAPQDEPAIIDILSENLPNDQRGDKGVDRLLKQLRF